MNPEGSSDQEINDLMSIGLALESIEVAEGTFVSRWHILKACGAPVEQESGSREGKARVGRATRA